MRDGALALARRLARKGRFRTAPNPMVGAVVERDGEIVGTGYHREVGGPHAEVEALTRAGERARGATLYVTLEPCCHHGRTPPCTDAVVAAGIARVVASHRDPNPIVGGRGFSELRARGVEVEVGVGLQAAARLNWRYLVAALRRRPAVTLKWAMTLDGRIATTSGDSRWISSPAGRRWAQELRDENDAILVGSGTVLADDPRLDRRLGRARGPILRVVLDRRLRTPPESVLLTVPGPVLVYHERGGAARVRGLTERGAEVVRLERVDPGAVLADLSRRRVQSLLVEGGAGIHGAFVAAGAFDRVCALIAPLLVGGAEASGPVGGEGVSRMGDALRLSELRVRRRGVDRIFEGFAEGCLPDLYASVVGS